MAASHGPKTPPSSPRAHLNNPAIPAPTPSTPSPHKAVAPATGNPGWRRGAGHPPRARRAADHSDLPSATTASTLNPLSSTHEHAQWPHPAISTPWAQPRPQSRRAATRPKSNQIANPTPKLRRGPKSKQSPILHSPASESAKKTLHYPTKLNIQTRPAGDPAVATPQRSPPRGRRAGDPPSPHLPTVIPAHPPTSFPLPPLRHSRSHHSVIPAKAGIQGGGAVRGSPLPPYSP